MVQQSFIVVDRVNLLYILHLSFIVSDRLLFFVIFKILVYHFRYCV